MGFGILDDSDKGNLSPGSIGGKIKRFREARGLTQQQLGVMCGYRESTAYVRISQYENNKKIPKDDALRDIAAALGVDESAFFDGDLSQEESLYHALFEMDFFHGLHPIKIADNYYLGFSSKLDTDVTVIPMEYTRFLKSWYEGREKYRPLPSDSQGQREQKAKDYLLWCGEYTEKRIQDDSDKLNDARQREFYQAKIDEIDTRSKGPEELARIDSDLETVLPAVRKEYSPIKKESDFIYIVKDLIAIGIQVLRYDQNEEWQSKTWHILSVKTSYLKKNTPQLAEFARLVCAFETLQSLGIQIERSVVSRMSELYITYRCPFEFRKNFENLSNHWDEMEGVVNGKGVLNEAGRQRLEECFREKVTGENDVSFPATDT